MMFSRRSVLSGSSAAIIAGAAPRPAWGKTEADVIIIGAGLSGLNAARILEAAGKKVIVVEGERHIGGRLHTLDDLPGRPEAGGIQIGTSYKRLRTIATEVGVMIDDGPGGGAGAVEARTALFNIGGQSVAPADWPGSAVNRLAPGERKILPLALGFIYGAKLPQFERPDGWLEASTAQDISFRAALIAAGASEEALRLIEVNMNGNTLAGMSAVQMMRAAAIFRASPGPTATIRGGSQRLPEAMAKGLKTPVRLGQLVSAISEDASGVAVTLTGGRTMRATQVICTIPFAALRHIQIEARLAPAIATLIPSLPYTRASFAYLSATSPFWKEDGLPETLWTDDPLLGRVFVLGDSPPMLKVWTVGAAADVLDQMPQAAAASEIVSRIEAARPSSKGKIRVERFWSWQKSPMARGIYHHIGTGQASNLADATRAEGKRLHFAGEHLARSSSGMEAALESGEHVARLILSRG